MTRDFNKQQRNDSRPPFRNSSSKQNRRDEHTQQSSRSSRPRLNREVVDRAWESGAPQRHADYRPRETNRQGGQYNRSPRNSQRGHYEQYGDAPRNSQRGQYGNSPRSSQNYNTSNTSHGNNHYSDSNYNARRDRDDRGFQDRQQGNGQYPGARNTRGNQRNSYRGDGDYRDNRDNHFNSSSRFSQQDRNTHTGGRNSYGNENPRFNRRDDHREYDERSRSNSHYERRGYSQRPYQGRNQERDERSVEQRNGNRRAPRQSSFDGSHAQYEGDYESFNEQPDYTDRPSRPARSEDRPFRGSTGNRGQRETQRQRDGRPYQRHVTPLPDGRVVKGSRPAQRRNAQFWTDVSEETDELLNSVSSETQNDTEPATTSQELSKAPEKTVLPEDTGGVSDNGPDNGGNKLDAENAENAHTTLETDNNSEFAATREAIRRRTRAASAVVREKKENRSKSTGPKPSQRGFKWPTP